MRVSICVMSENLPLKIYGHVRVCLDSPDIESFVDTSYCFGLSFEELLAYQERYFSDTGFFAVYHGVGKEIFKVSWK